MCDYGLLQKKEMCLLYNLLLSFSQVCFFSKLRILFEKAGFCGKNIAGVLATACPKTSRHGVVACDIFSQKSMAIIIDLRRNCQHDNDDTNNFDEILLYP